MYTSNFKYFSFFIGYYSERYQFNHQQSNEQAILENPVTYADTSPSVQKSNNKLNHKRKKDEQTNNCET